MATVNGMIVGVSAFWKWQAQLTSSLFAVFGASGIQGFVVLWFGFPSRAAGRSLAFVPVSSLVQAKMEKGRFAAQEHWGKKSLSRMLQCPGYDSVMAPTWELPTGKFLARYDTCNLQACLKGRVSASPQQSEIKLQPRA